MFKKKEGKERIRRRMNGRERKKERMNGRKEGC
jgi:hypothetical protein